MEKKLIIAIALSIFIIVGFQYLFVKPSIQASRKTAESVPEAQERPAPDTNFTKAPEGPSPDENEAEMETDKYMLTFSNIGGAIKKIQLKDYKKAGTDEALILADITNPREYIFSMNDNWKRLSLNNLPYEVNRTRDEITYSLKTEGLEITKRYILHNHKHLIELQLLVRNISGSPKELSYHLVGGSGLKETKPDDKRFVEVTAKIDGTNVNFKRPKQKIINPGNVNWSALKSKYFSIVLKPLAQTKNQFYSEGKDGILVSGVETQDVTIPAGSFIENRFVLYAGPSQTTVLKEAGYEFDETINYGFFGGISKALLAVMRICYNLTHSWGISVILLAVFLNILLFPLTLKSFKSMQKMQALHPQMEKLKAQNKDNPQRLNKEMMELYRKHKINPFGGCLPLLLQMPIFFALYQALIKSIELRGSGFLWIKDLSMPDAVKIPVALPILGNSINILPILMIIATIIQQNLSTKSMGTAVTEEQKQQQRMMMFMMPVMFGLIFYNMPSGLVLYWLVNTVLTVLEQFVIFKPQSLTNEAG
jgi:YidC/Oxa1 family membrane protein insertase